MLTLSSPLFGAKTCSAHSAAPRFAGKEEYEAYLKKLQEFTPQTVDMLAEITRVQKTDSSRHIAVASRFSKENPQIKWFASEIHKLLAKAKPDATEDPAEDLQKAATDILIAHGYDESGNCLDKLA